MLKVLIDGQWKEYDVEFVPQNGQIVIQSETLQNAIEDAFDEDVVSMAPVYEKHHSPSSVFVELNRTEYYNGIGERYESLSAVFLTDALERYLELRNLMIGYSKSDALLVDCTNTL